MLHTFVSPLYLESPHTLRTPLLSTPMPSDFQFKRPFLLTELQKATCGIGVVTFWNHPMYISSLKNPLNIEIKKCTFSLFSLWKKLPQKKL